MTLETDQDGRNGGGTVDDLAHPGRNGSTVDVAHSVSDVDGTSSSSPVFNFLFLA